MKTASYWILTVCLCVAGCSAPPTPGGGGRSNAPPNDPGVGQPGPLDQPITVFLTSTKTVLIRQDALEGSTSLTALASKAATFEWQNDAPAGLLTVGSPVSITTTDGTTGSRITLTALGDPGATGREVTITVTARDFDVPELADTQNLTLRVIRSPGALAISVSTPQARIAPGSPVTLTARISGGKAFTLGDDVAPCSGTGSFYSPPGEHPAYRVCWSGSFVSDVDPEAQPIPISFQTPLAGLTQNDQVTVSTATYTAPVETGAVVFTVEARDASGNRVTATTTLIISSLTGLQVVGVSDPPARVDPGATAAITATVVGGKEPYTVVFGTEAGKGHIQTTGLETLDAQSNLCHVSGVLGISHAEPDASDITQVPATYQAPLIVTTDVVTIDVCDSVGARAQDILPLTITPGQVLAVFANAQPGTIHPAGSPLPTSATITATAVGGTEPYSYAATLEPGGPGGTLTVSGTTGSGTYTAPNNKVGTAVIKIVVTDSSGQNATTFVNVVVAQAQALSATLTADSNTMNKDSCKGLKAMATGGVPPYSYEFTIDTAANQGCLYNYDPLAPPLCDNLHACIPPTPLTFDSNATGDTAWVGYRSPNLDTSNVIRGTVTDAVGSQVEALTAIIVGAPGQLGVAAYASPSTTLIGPCGGFPPYPVHLNAVVVGSPVSYAWAQESGPGGGVGVFENANPPAPGLTTWCPGIVPGEYVLRLTVTDINALIVTAFVTVNVAGVSDITVVPNIGNPPQVSVGQTVTLNQPIIGGAGQLSFLWSFDSTPGAPPAFAPNATSQSVTFAPNVWGDYHVRCTVSDLTARFVEKTLIIHANPALDAVPTVGAGVLCITGLPASGTIDITTVTLHANPSGGVLPYAFSNWSASVGPTPAPATAQDPIWTIPSTPIASPVIFSVTVTDATASTVDRSGVVTLAPPVRLSAYFPNPAIGNVNVPLQLTFFRDINTGTGIIMFKLTNTSGPGSCTVPPWTVFGDPSIAFVTCDTVGAYQFTADFKDDCSAAVVSSAPFAVTMN